MVASPAPSTRLARAVSQRRQQRKERSPVKQQHEKTTISTATGTDGSKPSNWWIQGGIVSNSTDEMTVSSQSAVSYVSNGTGTSSNRSAAANRRRLRIAQQKDALPTDRAPELRVSVGSDSVPKTVLTPRATNSLSRSIFSLAQKRVSGSDASSNASATVSSPTPLTPSAQNSRLASNRFLKLTEERDKFQKDATLLKQQARSATEAKNVAEKEKNEAINFMEHQIESLQETLKAITEQMGMVQINEQALHDKQLNDSKSNVAVLQKRLQQMAVVNEGLVEKVREATKNEQAVADMKRTIARTKSEHASVVESLRKDLAAAKQILDDKQSSFKSDVEAVKRNHAKEVSFYKEEIEGFRAQLKTAMKNADRSDVKGIERELAESRNENRELVKQLKQAQDAANRLKANSEKDVQLLESELDKTHKTKVDVELELKETKRQLSSALQNLDEMTEDGEHMQIKVEGMMAGFTKEKENFQNEITILKRDREEKLALMDELRREKIAVDIDSKNLQQNVRDLEMKLRGAEKFISDLENEVQSLKSKKEQNSPEHAITEIVNVNQLRDDKASLQNQLDSKEKSMINLRQTNRDLSMKLSKAQQTIHKLQSKEKYLESRVESLSNQISQTVHDYEIKLANC